MRSPLAMTIFPREGVISRRALGGGGEGGAEGAGVGGAVFRDRSSARATWVSSLPAGGTVSFLGRGTGNSFSGGSSGLTGRSGKRPVSSLGGGRGGLRPPGRRRGSRSGRLRRGALDDSRLRPREVDGSRQVGQVHDHHVRGPKRGEGNHRRQHHYRQMEQDGEGDQVFQKMAVRHKILLYPTIVPTVQFMALPLP